MSKEDTNDNLKAFTEEQINNLPKFLKDNIQNPYYFKFTKFVVNLGEFLFALGVKWWYLTVYIAMFTMNFYFIWRFWLRFTGLNYKALTDPSFLVLFITGCVLSLGLLRNHHWAVNLDPGFAGDYKIDPKSNKVKNEDDGEAEEIE